MLCYGTAKQIRCVTAMFILHILCLGYQIWIDPDVHGSAHFTLQEPKSCESGNQAGSCLLVLKMLPKFFCICRIFRDGACQYWIKQPRIFPELCYSKAVNSRSFSCAKSNESVVRTLITCNAEMIYLWQWQQNYTFMGKMNWIKV